MSRSVLISYCGVCCSHCGMQVHVPKMAKELRRFVEAYGYGEWIEHITRDFDFENFTEGLQWFANSNCPGCLQGGGMPNCEVKNCCIEKRLKNCCFCKEFLNCEKLSYQKETYKIDENHRRIKHIGYENWLEEQEEKLRQNFDNIHFLKNRKIIR